MNRESGDAVTVVAHEIGPFGGMESQLAELVHCLLSLGVEVTAIGRHVRLEPDPLLKVVELRGPARPFPLAYLWFFAVGTAAVARHRKGAVYTLGATVLNRVDARKVPFCHIAWARSPQRASRASRDSIAFRLNALISGALSRLAERVVYRPSRSGELVAMSTEGAATLERIFPAMAPVPVIPNGIDVERFRPDPARRAQLRRELAIADDELVTVFLGGDWQRKGLPQTIEAIAASPRWRLLVAGDGDADAMRSLADRQGAGDRVEFLGRIDDPERLLAAADALTMPSLYEPWGNAVLEACACGLPVVVAPADGVRDFIDDGRSGLVVRPDARSIAVALGQLSDPLTRARLGTAARERAAGYSYPTIAERYLKLLAPSAPTELRPVAATPQ